MTKTHLKLNNFDQFQSFLNDLDPKIGTFGGLYLKRKGDGAHVKLNDLVKVLRKFTPTLAADPDRNEKTKSLIKKIRAHDQAAKDLLNKKNLFYKLTTSTRRFFGNLFFKRSKVLNQIEFPNQTPVTSRGNYRFLPLKGKKGSVACRVRGKAANTFPLLSKGGNFEFVLRTNARLRNLIAVRGDEKGSRMIGPCDYYGNIEKPYESAYTIHIDDEGIPVFFQHKKEELDPQTKDAPKIDPSSLSTKLKAKWLSNQKPDGSAQENDQPLFGESLFSNKGILKIAGGDSFELEKIDATQVDLTSFKARLVDNNSPFQISKKKIPSLDDYRVITYHYESQYAEKQVQKGGGLFLETHPFAQTITPLDKSSRGFVTLAKWTKDPHDTLEVIAVEIPYGYTLIVEEECIHGDTNLDGMFMMCMTSNHKTMRKADTVFLKNSEGKKNITLSIKGGAQKTSSEESHPVAPLPNVIYNQTT
ncbi:MAG: hypothetical protein CK425_01610 [Parachlamydia sp.]|nr:MAG: hypothetical protein CK425_01610 [Parachlamydia sp.]